MSPSGGSYPDNAVITPVATPAPGYEFSYWAWITALGDVHSSENQDITFAMWGDISATAHFTKATGDADDDSEVGEALCTLTVFVYPQDGGSISPGGGSCQFGDQVTLSASPNPGYQFSHWAWRNRASYSHTSDSHPITLQIHPWQGIANPTDFSVTAHFVESSPAPGLSSVKTFVAPAGGGSVSPGPGSYPNKMTSFTATPASGRQFSHWSLSFLGPNWAGARYIPNNPLNIQLWTDLWATAHFYDPTSEPRPLSGPHTLTTLVWPPSSGTVSPDSVTHQDYSGAVDLTPSPAAGYEFSHWVWTADASQSHTISSIPSRMHVLGDMSVTAHFAKIGASTDTDTDTSDPPFWPPNFPTDIVILDDPFPPTPGLGPTQPFPPPEPPEIAPPLEQELRVIARRLDNGRTEFGLRVPVAGADEETRDVLPTRRFFPASANVGQWLRSSETDLGGGYSARVIARLLADGRIEFGVLAIEPEAAELLPQRRFFPAQISHERWLVSSEVTLPTPDLMTPLPQ